MELVPELPAARTTRTPALSAYTAREHFMHSNCRIDGMLTVRTPLSRMVSAPPPKVINITAGRFVDLYLDMTKFIPATIPEVVPDPDALITCTAIAFDFLAAPYVDPIARPAR